MKKNAVMIGGGVLGGLVLALVLTWFAAPSLMLMEDESRYGFEESVERFEAKAQAQGWKIPAVHDLQATMKKFGKDVVAVKVFELCHPKHAYEILSRDKERIVASMMPCRVAIYQKSDGKTYVSRMNTSLMGSMMAGVIPEVMAVASAESEAILGAILR